MSSAALALFAFGQAEAAKRGLLLVDTKYEFGKDSSGAIRLIDEVPAPDTVFLTWICLYIILSHCIACAY